MKLNRNQVKLIQLACQGLLEPPAYPISEPDVLKTIRAMGILQIDTIHVVARSPYFVLWSRLGNYDPNWLDLTQNRKEIFEYWAHAASYIPIEDYPLFRRKMLERTHNWWNVDEWVNNHNETVQKVLHAIETNGPVASSDFTQPKGTTKGWWDWKEEKKALDVLWTRGDLMVPYRKKFKRFYDLQSRVMPDWNDDLAPSLESITRQMVEKTISILGITRPKWVADYYRLSKASTSKAIRMLLEEEIILKIESEEWEDGLLIHRDRLPLVKQADQQKLTAQHTTLLSPFDPLIWDRTRTKELFNFDYTIECYLPAPKRKYGYFSLPILYRGNLVGRLDAKAHRKEKIFEVRQFHLEAEFKPDSAFKTDLLAALQSCAQWHQTPEVVFPFLD